MKLITRLGASVHLFPLWLWTAAVLAGEPAPAPALPVELQPFAALAEAASRYQRALETAGWRTVWEEDFAPGHPVAWEVVKEEDSETAIIENRQADDRPVLALVTPAGGAARLAIGPAVSGAVAVEMVARSETDRPCDLSLFLGGVGAGPGFQFGGHYNTRNLLSIDAPGGAGYKQVTLPTTLRIKPHTWHRVRMTVRDRRVTGAVDGRVLGSEPLTEQYDATRPRRVEVYGYDSTVLLARITIQQFDAASEASERKQAWPAAFGDRTQAAVGAEIDGLIRLLNHERNVVREGAQRLLAQFGALATPALRVAARSGPIEQQLRARELVARGN